MKQKDIILWSLLPVIILVTSLYGYRELRVIQKIYFKPSNILQQRTNNPYKPNKVMIGSSLVKSIVGKYPKKFYNYGVAHCGHVVGMRYFFTRHALDNIPSADIYFIAMNEHWGDGIFVQSFLDKPTKRIGRINQELSCKKLFDDLQQLYPIEEYIIFNNFYVLHKILDVNRLIYQQYMSSKYTILKYFNAIFGTKNTAFNHDKIELDSIKIHPLADKYLRKSIDVLLENNKKVVIIRTPQGDKTIKIMGKKVAVLKDYMLQLQKDYDDKIYILDYLYKFAGKPPVKGFDNHLRHKPYLDILHNDMQQDLKNLGLD